MSISAIGGTPSTFYSPSVRNTQNIDSDGDNDGSGVKGVGAGRKHGGGGFMQSVMQALQGMGLSFPGQAVNQLSATNSAGSNSNQSSTSSGASDPGQVLHTFLHDLRQALHQQSSQPTTSPQTTASTDNDGDNDNSGSNSTVQSNGYHNFDSKLSSLISMLGSNSGATGTPGIGDKLQADFASLTQALAAGSTNGSSVSSTTTPGSTATPDLLSFLKNLETNLVNNHGVQKAAGSLINTAA